MLQSWENFMSPSGGYMESDVEFGMKGFMYEIGAELAPRFLYKPLHKTELMRVRERFSGTVDRIKSKKSRLLNNTLPNNYAHGYGPNEWRRPHLNPNYKSKTRALKHNITSKYRRLSTSARSIGWGYLALTAAAGVEALATPGLSKAAAFRDEQAMAGPLDSSQAYTQRKRALMAIHDSQLGIRNVIGGEAGYMHR